MPRYFGDTERLLDSYDKPQAQTEQLIALFIEAEMAD